MKLQPMTGRHWIELFFGPVLSIIFVWPPLLMSAIFAGLSQKFDFLDVAMMFVCLSVSLLGLLSIVPLSLLILFGVEQINQRSWLRWFSIWSGILAWFSCVLMILLALVILFQEGVGWHFFLLGAFAPATVWWRYLRQLFKRTT